MDSSISEFQKLLQSARLNLAQGQLHEAVAQASEVIRLDAKEPSAYLVRAEAQRRLSRPDRALADLAVAIRLDPHQPGPYVIRAEILKRRNLFDQAIADATYALILDQRNAAAFSVRAECRNAIGDPEGAREDVQEMLCIDPTRPVPHLEARGASSSSDVEMGDERFWKQAGNRSREDERALFADGKPVDKTYRSRPVVSDEEAPEALGVASGYKPGTIPAPLPRVRAPRERRSPAWLLIGLGFAGAGLIGFLVANQGQVAPDVAKAPPPTPTDRVLGKIEAGVPAAVNAGPATNAEPVTGIPRFRQDGDQRRPDGGAAMTETISSRELRWVSIRNGNPTSGSPVFREEGGILVGDASVTSYLRTEEVFEDFSVGLEYQFPRFEVLTPRGSGVLLATPDQDGVPFPAGIECQVMPGETGDLCAFGDFAVGGPGTRGGEKQVKHAGDSEYPRGEWNKLEIRCKGRSIIVNLNGQVVNRGDCNHPLRCRIALMSQGSDVNYRNISITHSPTVTTTRGRPGSGPIPPAVLAPAGRENSPTSRIARTGVGNDRLPPPPKGKTWVMVWHDEFDGAALDTAKWTPSPEGGRRSGWWSPKAVSLDGRGHLVVKTYKDGDRYVDGCVTSQGKLEHAYGYYVARLMFQREQGHWAGLWMLSPGVFKVGDGGRDGTEIDIVASAGRDDLVNHSLHWDGYGEAHKTAAKQVNVPGVMDGYHTFGLLWTPEEYVFYVDGRETWRTSAGGVSQVPEYLLISDEVLDSVNEIGRASLPDHFLVDYVRVYDLADGGVGSASTVARQISPIAAPEIANLTEINTKRTDFCAWPSPDGLTLYWVIDGPGGGEGEIWSARRKDTGSLFGDKRLVAYGRHITVSADGLTMFLVARRADGEPGDSIQVARRRSTGEAFGRPQAVPELASIESPRNLFLSADARTFLFVTGAGDGEAARPWVTTRPSPESPWGTPRPLVISAGPGIEGHVICPHLTSDGLTILGVLTRDGDPRPEFVTWTRSGADRPFTGPQPLQLPGVKEFYGWQPRYVEATHELFFCSNRLAADRGDVDIWVVRNFVLPP